MNLSSFRLRRVMSSSVFFAVSCIFFWAFSCSIYSMRTRFRSSFTSFSTLNKHKESTTGSVVIFREIGNRSQEHYLNENM